MIFMLLIFKNNASGTSMTVSRVPQTRLHHELVHHLNSAEILREQGWEKEGGWSWIVAAVPEGEAQV